MTRDEIAERVIKVVDRVHDRVGTEITPETTLSELGWDSLDLVELAMYIEDEFAIEVTDAEMNAAKSVEDWISLAEMKVSGV